MRLTLSGFFNSKRIKTTFSSSSTAQPILARISLESTDKELFLPILSVIAIFRASHLRTEGPSYTITITVDTVILSNAEPDESARQTILGYFHHGRQPSCIRKKPDYICD